MTQVSIVHERFTEFAGSEQVVAQFADLWPDAPITAPIALPGKMPPPLDERITTTRLSSLLQPGGGYAHLLPVLPLAMRRLRLGNPDVVVASHHAFANQVVHATDAPVISYVHSPARWVWDPQMRVGEAGGRLGSLGLGAFAAMYRPADRRAAARLAGICANSSAVATRVSEWWGCEAEVVHPPVNTDFYTPDATVVREDFLLLAGRMVPYKRPLLAIQAAERAGARLVVAGDGRMRDECMAVAGPNTTFLGRVSDDELRDLFRRCAALLMPGIEDFGIVPVEAQACGAPVIATAAGGAVDTVLPHVTGELVPGGASELSENWTTVLSNFSPSAYDNAQIRAHAERFSAKIFRQRMARYVSSRAR